MPGPLTRLVPVPVALKGLPHLSSPIPSQFSLARAPYRYNTHSDTMCYPPKHLENVAVLDDAQYTRILQWRRPLSIWLSFVSFDSQGTRLTRLQGRTVDTERLLIRNVNACFSPPSSAPLTASQQSAEPGRLVDRDDDSLGRCCRLPGALFVYVTCETSTLAFLTFARCLLITLLSSFDPT
jgi:hypothetical protein